MIVRSARDLAALRRANTETVRLLRDLQAIAVPGVTTRELDDVARERIRELGGEPVFETQAGFPGAINTNRNDIVVHGVPGDERIEDGDILTIDAGMLLDGYAGDAATTFAVGAESPRHAALIGTAHGSMLAAIAAAKTGNRLGDVSHAMQSHAEQHGCSVARDFCGHGLGTRMWEPPNVMFHGKPNTGERLIEGMVITIEPVVIEGTWPHWMDGRWAARTKDGSWVAQFERAVMVTSSGGLVLADQGSSR